MSGGVLWQSARERARLAYEHALALPTGRVFGEDAGAVVERCRARLSALEQARALAEAATGSERQRLAEPDDEMLAAMVERLDTEEQRTRARLRRFAEARFERRPDGAAAERAERPLRGPVEWRCYSYEEWHAAEVERAERAGVVARALSGRWLSRLFGADEPGYDVTASVW